jgi:ELWxxDGT repeat protein
MVIILLLCIVPYNPELPVETEIEYTGGMIETAIMVKNINSGNDDGFPSRLAHIGNTLYFNADDGIYGSELWKSDGTDAGTVMVKDIRNGNNHSIPQSLVTMGNTLYFNANDGTNGQELWKSDGTEAGTVMVKDIRSGSTGSSPFQLTAVGNTLYFQADDGNNGVELWKSDGTTSGTVMVKDVKPGADSGALGGLTVVANTLYFVASDGTHGSELWKSDGTANGTMMVKDISDFDTDCNCNPGGLVVDAALMPIGNSIFFSADDGDNGHELWKSDGTANGTMMVKDISGGSSPSYPAELTVVGSTLFFSAKDSVGRELWKSDGTASGTVMVKNIWTGSSGPGDGDPKEMTSIGNTLYFQAKSYDIDGDGSLDGAELWKSDGTNAGTVRVKDINTNTDGSSTPELLTVFNNELYFKADDGVSGVELWKSDGTEAGTVMLKDITSGITGSHPDYLTAVGNTLYFQASDGVNGAELWKTVKYPEDAASADLEASLSISSSGSSFVFWYNLTAITPGWDYTIQWDYEYGSNGSFIAGSNPVTFLLETTTSNNGPSWTTPTNFDFTLDVEVCLVVSVYNGTSPVSTSLLDSDTDCINSPTWEDFMLVNGEGAGQANNNGNSIAIDGDGNIHVAYIDDSPGRGWLRYMKYDGISWSDWTVDSSNDQIGYASSIAIDENDDVHISYYDAFNKDLKYAFFDGSSWTTTVVDGVEGNDVGLFTSIITHRPCNICAIEVSIAYFDDSNNNLKIAQNFGDSWFNATIISGNIGYWVSLDVDSGGGLHIATRALDPDELLYVWSDGTNWSFETVDQSGDVGKYSSLTVDKDDDVHISYYDHTNTNLKYAYLDFDTSLWSTETVDGGFGAGEVGDVGKHSSLAIDGDDNLFISYYDESNKDLKIAEKYDDGDWNIETIDAAGNVGKYSEITIDKDDIPNVIYYEDSIASKGLKFSCLGCSVNEPILTPTITVNLAYLPATGKLHAGYVLNDLDGNSVYSLERNLFFQFNSSTIVSDSIGIDCDCETLSEFINWEEGDTFSGNDFVIIDDTAYCVELILRTSDGTSTSILDQRVSCAYFPQIDDDDLSWSTTTVPDASDNFGLYVDSALDSEGLPHYCYYDDENSNLKYATFDDDGWSIITVDGFLNSATSVEADVGTFCSIALDSEDHPHISYSDNTNKDLRFASEVVDLLNATTVWVSQVADQYPASDTSLAFSSDGTPHISYWWDADNGTSTTNSYWLMYANKTNGSWNNLPIVKFNDISTAFSPVGSQTSIVLTNSGAPFISYYQPISQDLNVAYLGNSGWWDIGLDTDGMVGQFSSIIINPANGAPYISYYDETNSALKISSYTSADGSGWENYTVVNDGDTGLYTSIMINEDGHISISYFDSTSNSIKYTDYKDNEWNYHVVDDSESAKKHISLEIDSDGEIYIAYYDIDSAELKLSCNTCDFTPPGGNDTDGDGYLDANDAFPLDSTEWIDTDGDGIGNNADTDDDDDGALDVDDHFPLDQSEDKDADGDGIGNNADTDDDDDGWSDTDETSCGTLPQDSDSVPVDADGNGICDALDTDGNNGGNEIVIRYYENYKGWYHEWFYNVSIVENATSDCQLENGIQNDSQDIAHAVACHYLFGPSNYIWNSTYLPDATDPWVGSYVSLSDGEIRPFLLSQVTGLPQYAPGWGLFIPQDQINQISPSLDETVRDFLMNTSNYITYTFDYSNSNNSNDGGNGTDNNTGGNGNGNGTDNNTSTDCSIWESSNPELANPALPGNGCPYYLSDSDEDGVSDEDDECESTPANSIVDAVGCLVVEEDEVVDDIESDEDPEDEWYSNIPFIGSQIDPLVEMVQTKYGKAISASVFVLTALGYAYRVVTVRSEMRMKKRMNNFEKRIDNASSENELRKIERDVEIDEEKNNLPLGGYGDLMSMIENREEDLGIGEGSKSKQMMSMASGMQAEMAESMQSMREAQEDIASMADSMRGSQSQQSRSGPPGAAMAAAARPAQTSTGMSRPSYHPKDMDEDGFVSDEDLAKFNSLSKAEQIARQSRAGDDKGLTGEIVRFSKLPRSSKARCYCGSNKQFGKCHLGKEKCPCNSGKKFLKCCAKKRNFR